MKRFYAVMIGLLNLLIIIVIAIMVLHFRNNFTSHLSDDNGYQKDGDMLVMSVRLPMA